MSKLADLEEKLAEKGYKITNQRRAILEVFLQAGAQYLTAQGLFERVLKKLPRTNFSTVYRNLGVLKGAGIISEVDTGQGTSGYVLTADDSHHHHLVCRSCGRMRKIDFCPLQNGREFDWSGFVPLEHKFEIYGYCRRCAAQLAE
ncbi:Fur family transcriptional regulator [Calderihabitans maritimus]|uniref:Ferric uptake regulator family protein n=1 Tax=Calderihabitans maritimus TaxID=1246530 RepID=A0A1Z5HY03_9FIRM|nr:Fur family transcriptional regulator [Calderihabitans maritimus]GAW94384.1 ferric uptake regulator family protein [Calderihabitans maritimus]